MNFVTGELDTVMATVVMFTVEPTDRALAGWNVFGAWEGECCQDYLSTAGLMDAIRHSVFSGGQTIG